MSLRSGVASLLRSGVSTGATALGLTLVERRGRLSTIRPDDTLLVSYPRSGSNWVSFLLSNLLFPKEPTSFLNEQQRIPDIYYQTDRQLQGFASPRILKSHEYLNPRYGRVIYVVRDPRDVVVSYFRFMVSVGQIPDNYPMTKFVDRFMEGSLDEFGNWGDHVGGWRGARADDNDFLFVRYEDILADPLAWLGAMTSFLRWTPSDGELARAIELSSADKMRELERLQRGQGSLERVRPDFPFVGRAKAGSGLEDLAEGSFGAITDRWDPLIRSLGYDGG